MTTYRNTRTGRTFTSNAKISGREIEVVTPVEKPAKRPKKKTQGENNAEQQ